MKFKCPNCGWEAIIEQFIDLLWECDRGAFCPECNYDLDWMEGTSDVLL